MDQDIWEEKIIGWEDGRYKTATGKSSILERESSQHVITLSFRICRALLLPRGREKNRRNRLRVGVSHTGSHIWWC